MTIFDATTLDEMRCKRREEQERKRREILEHCRRRATSGTQSPAVRLPTEEELEDALLEHEGDAADGTHRSLRDMPYATYGVPVSEDMLLIENANQLVPHGATVRLVCIHADGFESADAIVAWLAAWKPTLKKSSPMPPRYWVVGSEPLGWQELGTLDRMGASYERLPAQVDIPEWLEKQFSSSAGEYRPPSPTPPVRAAPYSGDGTSSLDSWERDREEIARAHARGLQRKDELLSRADDDENSAM